MWLPFGSETKRPPELSPIALILSLSRVIAAVILSRLKKKLFVLNILQGQQFGLSWLPEGV